MPSIYINETSPTTARLDFSASPSDLANTETCYGFAYQKTLEHLGVDCEAAPRSPSYGSLMVEGSPDAIKSNIPDLQRHIGVIARYAAERRYGSAHDRAWIGGILGRLVQNELPAMPEGASFLRSMGIIAAPFGHAVIPGHDILRIYYKPTEQADDQLRNPFSVRDIGGLLVGTDGLPAREAFRFSFSLHKEEVQELMLIHRVREPDTHWANDILFSVEQGIANNHVPAVSPSAASERERKILTNLSRDLLEKLYAIGGKLNNGASLADLVAFYVRSYLDKCANDPLIQAKVAAEKERLRQLYSQQ